MFPRHIGGEYYEEQKKKHRTNFTNWKILHSGGFEKSK